MKVASLGWAERHHSDSHHGLKDHERSSRLVLASCKASRKANSAVRSASRTNSSNSLMTQCPRPSSTARTIAAIAVRWTSESEAFTRNSR